MEVKDYINQGVSFLLTDEMTGIRLVASFVDPVDPEILQEAVNEVVAAADYYRIQMSVENDTVDITENLNPCLIYKGTGLRKIPSETNGYHFYVSYEEKTLCLTFDHFLTDGRGILRCMNELLKAYCRRRYDLPLNSIPLTFTGGFPHDELLSLYTRQRSQIHMPGHVAQKESGFTNTIVRLDKQDLIRYALSHEVKPFSALMYLIGRAVWSTLDEPHRSFSFPVDCRKRLGVDNALFNCVVVMNRGFEADIDDPELIKKVDAEVRQAMEPETAVRQMAVVQKTFSDLYYMNASSAAKKRVFQRTQRTTSSNFMLSYMGSLLNGEERLMEPYLADYYGLPLTCDHITPIMTLECSFKEYMHLTVVDMTEDDSYTKRICDEMDRASIRVHSVEPLWSGSVM